VPHASARALDDPEPEGTVPEKLMRILHTNAGYSPFVGGAETYLRAMSERLARDGHQVVVVATDATGVQSYWDPRRPRVQDTEAVLNGVRVVRCRLGHLPLAPWSFYLLRRLATDLSRPALRRLDTRPLLDRMAPWMPRVPRLEATLEALAPGFDLVQGVNIALEWPLLAGWRYARRHRLPFVATPFVHVGEREVQRFYTMPHQVAALRDADRVLVQTGIEGRALARLGVPEAKIVRLGMGVDLDELRGGDAARFRAQYAVDGPLVTFLGVLTDDKGVVHLLRAMGRLWDAGSEATLALAGPTVEPSGFQRAWATLPAAHRQRIRQLGVVREMRKQDLLAATDVLALPSRVDSFGIVYLEAWAYGVPVVGCRAGGVPDVVEHEVDGLLVDFGDVAGLAAALEALLADPGRRRTMGARGRAKVAERYTWQHVYRQLLAVYRELAG
jgi:glycosyltransferase involved in cell wall biosynthesis